MEKKETQKPVREIVQPFNGSILKAAIWRHQDDGKHPRFTVSVCRGYRAKEGDKWAFSGFFQRDETLGLARVLEAAHAWIVNETQQKDAKQ
jgi:hypothetical protein